MDERLERHDDRRNRLSLSECEDEPKRSEFAPFQAILDQAYRFKAHGSLADAWQLLGRTAHLSASSFQRARAEYLSGEYYRSQELLLPESERDAKRALLVKAAEHFRLGAEAARQVPDWATYAQLKSLETAAYATGEVQALQQAYESAREALAAWRSLPFRDLTPDVTFEFNLADTLAVRALYVGKFDEAVEALERAAVLLHRLRSRNDGDQRKYINDDVLLHWDWAHVHETQGDYRSAFHRIVQARRYIGGLSNPINIGRLHCVVASIALGCAEDHDTMSPTRGRLLQAAKAEITSAYQSTRALNDLNGVAMVLLADAFWLGLSGRKRGRIKLLKDAQKIASTLNDAMLTELVRMGWGDEYVTRGDLAKAAECYRTAETNLARLGHVDQARKARIRLDRQPPDVAPSASATTKTPPPNGDISSN